MIRRARLFRLAFVFAVFVVVGVLAMPGRLWFGQRNDIAQAQVQLAELKREHHKLSARVTTLSSDTIIEHEARENLGLVFPRDEVYSIPAAPPPLLVALPPVWPFTELQEPLTDAAADR